MNPTDALTILLQRARGKGDGTLESAEPPASDLLEAAKTLGENPQNGSLEFLRAMALQNVASLQNYPNFANVWDALRPNDEPTCDARPILTFDNPDTYDPQTGLFTVTVSVSATKSVSGLKPVLDPQAWDGQSHFFEESYVMPAADIDSQIPPSPARLLEARGTAWTGYLYEKVRCQDYVFQNVLYIECQSLASSYEFTYDMHRCAWSTIPGSPAGPGGLVKNFGGLTAVPNGNRTMITARKSFRFEDRLPHTGYQLGADLRDGLRAGWATALSTVLC